MGTNRCGTTYLFQLLKQYMGVDNLAYDEPFKKAIMTRSKDWDKAVEYFHETLAELKTAELVKDHAQTIDIVEDTLHTLDEYNALYADFYKIKVVRKNFKQAVVSMALAKTTNKYHYTAAKQADDLDNMRIEIDRETFNYYLKLMYYGFERLYELPNCMFDEVVLYEDITGDNKLDQELIKYTSNNVKDIKIDMVRSPAQNTVISNYDEVCAWFNEEIKNYSPVNFILDNGIVVSEN